MVYRLYVEVATSNNNNNNNIGYAYTFYNHQDFMVYKRTGKSNMDTAQKAIVEASAIALTYFERSIRRRYYDEHFSTRIDEDYVTLFTQNPEIAEVAKKCKETGNLDFISNDKDLWDALLPFFTQKTMMFENSSEERFISVAKELAKNAL